jgi:hypothetical protein
MREFLVLMGLMIFAASIAGCITGTGNGQQGVAPESTQTPSVSQTPFPTLPASFPENFSANWAGYVVQTSFMSPDTQAIDAIEAVWNVPAVDCSGVGTGDYAAAFWIGIDGFSSKSVEQIGTDSDCVTGVPVYYAWYELYPRDSVTLDIPLTPEDEVHATITYIGNQQFRFSLQDITSGQNISITETSTIAERVSAEWIAEAPVYKHKILPLSDFGPVSFLNASVTVKGKKGFIQNDQWEYRTVLMESADGVIKATPTGLLNRDSFAIIWEHQ